MSKLINFKDVPVGSSFWEKVGTGWFPSHKVDDYSAQYQTHCGLLYGETYCPATDLKVKVYL